MRCPKCHYLSFEPQPRCRNCGYGLSLEDGDLFIRDDSADPAPLADLSLQPSAATAPGDASRPGSEEALTTAVSETARRAAVDAPPADLASEPVESLPARVRAAPTTELPLFVKGLSSSVVAAPDEPLVTIPTAPRAPLSVRRATQDAPGPRPRPPVAPNPRKLGPLDRDLLADLQRVEKQELKEAQAERLGALRDADSPYRVGAVKRLSAAAVDAAFLGTIGVAIMWATLRWVDLPLDRALMVPVVAPTSAFVLLLGVMYMLMFTAAGGQTLGKMAIGLRVVCDEPSSDAGGTLTVRQALVRAVLTVPSVLVAGAGFVPALVGDERAVHDRLARTRVVRA